MNHDENRQMNHDEIKNLAQATAKTIKTEADLNEFRQIFMCADLVTSSLY
jgi:hypothetical protein